MLEWYSVGQNARQLSTLMLALYNSLPSQLGTVHEVGIENADSVECEDPNHKQDRRGILPKRSVVWLDMQEKLLQIVWHAWPTRTAVRVQLKLH